MWRSMWYLTDIWVCQRYDTSHVLSEKNHQCNTIVKCAYHLFHRSISNQLKHDCKWLIEWWLKLHPSWHAASKLLVALFYNPFTSPSKAASMIYLSSLQTLLHGYIVFSSLHSIMVNCSEKEAIYSTIV